VFSEATRVHCPQKKKKTEGDGNSTKIVGGDEEDEEEEDVKKTAHGNIPRPSLGCYFLTVFVAVSASDFTSVY